MKHLMYLLISIFLLSACNNNKKEESAKMDSKDASTEQLDSDHSAKNALDYEGTYEGILPTASGEGMKVTITLSGNNYISEIDYMGKQDDVIKNTGEYVWDSTGSIITLKGKEKPNEYFVGEDILIQLNIEGKKNTGALENEYILNKQD